MSLVTYSDSDTSPPQSPPHKSRKSRKHRLSVDSDLPPLPSSFHNLYASKVRISTSDDPSLHDGRKRATPHVEGTWPSHIFVEWIPASEDLQALEAIVENHSHGGGATEIHSLLRSELGVPLPLHISLSQSLSLATGERESFMERLKNNLNQCSMQRFSVHFDPPKWAANFSETRHFLVLPVRMKSREPLIKLLDASNATVENFGMPLLYASIADYTTLHSTSSKPLGSSHEIPTSARFHVSIAWSLKAQKNSLDAVSLQPEVPCSTASQLERTRISKAETEISGLKLVIKSVKVKIGNAVSEIGFNE